MMDQGQRPARKVAIADHIWDAFEEMASSMGTDRDSLINPDAIIEVLSSSTEKYDRGAKFRQYQQLTSVKEYVLVSQDEAVCERFVRQADGTWVLTIVTGLAGELTFSTIPVRIPLADIYNGVDFPEKTQISDKRPE